MVIRCCIVLLFLGMATLQAQLQKTIDSLELELQAVQDVRKKVDILNLLGYQYWVRDSKTSNAYGKRALQLAEKLEYIPGAAMANRVLGVSYWTFGEPKKALEHLNRSQELYASIDNLEGTANALMNSGMVYADIGEHDRALQIYNRSIQLFTKLELKRRIATTFTKIGAVLLRQGKLDKAKEYLTNALIMHNKDGYRYGQAEAHNRLGQLYLDEAELEQAEHHLTQAIALSRSISDVDGLISSTIQKGRLQRLRNNLFEADTILTQVMAQARQKKLKRYELAALKELKLLKRQEGNLEESIRFYDMFIALRDSLFNTEKSKQIAALEFDNELQQQQKEIALLKENERVKDLTNLVLFIGLIGISVIGFLMFRHQKLKNKKNKELMTQQQQLLLSQEELGKRELENAQLKERELQRELDFKNKELTSYTLNFVQKNQLLSHLERQIDEIQENGGAASKKLMKLKRTIKASTNMDKDWQDFRRFFEEVHSIFISRLNDKHPEVSSNDLRIAALVRLNLNIKESASILGISPESVKTARYRLRKKIGLTSEQELLDYFLQLEREI